MFNRKKKPWNNTRKEVKAQRECTKQSKAGGEHQQRKENKYNEKCSQWGWVAIRNVADQWEPEGPGGYGQYAQLHRGADR